MQRYMQHFPAKGEVVIFDRSWYNRAGVEYVMGFCTKEQHQRFLELCPLMENYIVEGGIQIIKVWLEVSDKEQKRRFEARMEDPLRQWKLSPMDLPSRAKWFEYSRARDMMLKATDTKWAPWYILHSDDKKRARLNCIRHILDLIPYKKAPREKVKLPKRSMKGAYDDEATLKWRKLCGEVLKRPLQETWNKTRATNKKKESKNRDYETHTESIHYPSDHRHGRAGLEGQRADH